MMNKRTDWVIFCILSCEHVRSISGRVPVVALVTKRIDLLRMKTPLFPLWTSM
ncbi:hypothetical protein SCEN_P00120 [Saccharomyces cerevisiae]|nr:hypothetical protein SCEN_P00120 [Saccharomyces cerevisiae]